MGSPEHAEQVAVVTWARWRINQHAALEWLHAIPNGAKFGSNRKLAAIQAGRLKAEGLLPGVPDLFLPYPAHGYHGYYIEMKRPGNIKGVRDGQRDFMAWAESVGYLCQVHDSAESAIESIKWYLEMK